MPWPKGRSRPKPPTSGRKKGVQNKRTREVQVWAREILEDPLGSEKTRELYRRGKLAPAIQIELLHYAYGKPKDTLVVETPRPVVLDLLTGEPNDSG